VAACVVFGGVAEAAALVARGVNVVLVIETASEDVVMSVDGPGRLAVLVGSLAAPETLVAAEAMAAELFGGA
jgi:hypothetical protein